MRRKFDDYEKLTTLVKETKGIAEDIRRACDTLQESDDLEEGFFLTSFIFDLMEAHNKLFVSLNSSAYLVGKWYPDR